jgi:uncharacterized protein
LHSFHRQYLRMNFKKIFNDPVYGFISIPFASLFTIIEHPYFQRLRHIKQMGLAAYVYPGALHTRFHHALGAMHLIGQAIEVLQSKDVVITPEESEGAQLAMLLHDIGHGPFSHGLEKQLINIHHETMTLCFMARLNEMTNGSLTVAIEIFKGTYPKKFLHQLVSGQLDMDRLDYLNRDSFFTGVAEGVIGYDRIIKMLAVHDGKLVVEEKGIYSVERFLTARRLMYWQVYLHKTALVAEQMLVRLVQRVKELVQNGTILSLPEPLLFFFKQDFEEKDLTKQQEILDNFALLDDNDIFYIIKKYISSEDKILSFLSKCLLNRRLFKVEVSPQPFKASYLKKIRQQLLKQYSETELKYYLIQVTQTKSSYDPKKAEEIYILFKTGVVKPMSECTDYDLGVKNITKHYLCYPKNIL